MKLALLGASGLTGKLVVEQALDAGHHVTAIVRTPSKMNNIQHEHLNIVKANIFDANDMKEHLDGQDALISTLGFPPCPRTCT